jgi:hypothetical protein
MLKFFTNLFSNKEKTSTNDVEKISSERRKTDNTYKFMFDDELPYKLKEFLLTDREKEFYKVLLPIVQKYNLLVAIKPRIADFIELTLNREHKKHTSSLSRISQKHVDFLLCDSSMRPIIAVELDDSSHDESNRKDRDEFVDKVYKKVGFPIKHIYDYTPDSLNLDIIELLFFRLPIKCLTCGEGIYELKDSKNGFFLACTDFKANEAKQKPTCKGEDIKIAPELIKKYLASL